MNGPSTKTASSAQDCLNQIYEIMPPIAVFSYNADTGDCIYSVSYIGCYLRSTDAGPPEFWVRCDGVLTNETIQSDTCITQQDAEYLIYHGGQHTDPCPGTVCIEIDHDGQKNIYHD
ncbi:hypothetical protein AAVH_27342 [Aphelenchoides avenae]|nr:hypothetical protein AAVH_27342 [Aphelenchus avenae]